MNRTVSFIAPRHAFLGAVIALHARPDDPDDWPRAIALASSLAEAGSGVAVVNDGGRAPAQDALDRLRALGCTYLQLDTQHRLPSAARARNIGAVASNVDYVLMLDPSVSVDPGVVDRLRAELRSPSFQSNGHAFATLPSVTLTPRGEALRSRTPPQDRAAFVRDVVARNDRELLRAVSIASTVCAYHRHSYLARGGCDERFEGAGFETLELNCRMIQLGCRYPEPQDWESDDPASRSDEYRGWRTVHDLVGEQSWAAGLFVVQDGRAPSGAHDADRARFQASLATPPHRRQEPQALPDAHAGRTLVVRANPFTLNRDVRPLFGALSHVDPERLAQDAPPQEHLPAEPVDRVVFHNPYVDAPTRRLYDHVRDRGIPVLVAERGGLNDSVFYDPNGFLADSASYARDEWDRDPSAEEADRTRRHIAEHKRSRRSLEAQGERRPLDALRRGLGLRPGEKVLFAPLQRPSDTATRFFARGPITYERHLEILAEVSARLPSGWRLICKRHPLEDARDAEVGLDGDALHVADLLELSDAVLTFNSGVGLQALLYETPTLVTGRAYYAVDGAAREVDSADDVLEALAGDLSFDAALAFRFLSHLVNRFYSFGTFRTKEVRMPEGHRMTVTRNIRFRELRALGREFRYRTDPEAPEIGFDAPQLARFRAAADRAEDPRPQPLSALGTATIADLLSRDLTRAVFPPDPPAEEASPPLRRFLEDEPRPLQIAPRLSLNYKPAAGERLTGQVLYTPSAEHRFGRLAIRSQGAVKWLLMEYALDRAALEPLFEFSVIARCRSERAGQAFTALRISHSADERPFFGRAPFSVGTTDALARSTFTLSSRFWRSVAEESQISFVIGAKEVFDGFTVSELRVLRH